MGDWRYMLTYSPEGVVVESSELNLLLREEKVRALIRYLTEWQDKISHRRSREASLRGKIERLEKQQEEVSVAKAKAERELDRLDADAKWFASMMPLGDAADEYNRMEKGKADGA